MAIIFLSQSRIFGVSIGSRELVSVFISVSELSSATVFVSDSEVLSDSVSLPF